MDVPMRIDGHIVEGQALDTQGHAVRATVIRGGQSKNGFTYCETALKTIANLLEGAHAYADHARSESDEHTRSVRDIVGFYHDAHYIPPCSEAPQGRVDATLHILEGADWLWSIIQEACTLGRPELIGLSIDIFGQWQVNEASKAKEVTSVATLNSCDVVTRPSAGGAFRRILHAQESLFQTQQGDIFPMSDTHSHLTETSSTVLPIQSSPTPGEENNEQNTSMPTGEQQFNMLLQQLQLERAQLALERRLLESVLPEPVKTTVRTRYQGRIFEQNELEADLKAQQEMLAALTATGLIRGNSYEKPAVGQMITEAEKIQAAFDRMFGSSSSYVNAGCGKMEGDETFSSHHHSQKTRRPTNDHIPRKHPPQD